MRLQLEKIIVFEQLGYFAVERIEGAVRLAVLVSQKCLLASREPPFVLLLVEMALVLELAQNGLQHRFVARLGSADEVVIGEIQLLRKGLPGDGQFIAIFLRLAAAVQRRLLDFLPVFVEAGQKKHRLTEASAGAGYHVGENFFVGMAEVRLAIGVVDRGGQVKTFAHLRAYCGGAGSGWQLRG